MLFLYLIIFILGLVVGSFLNCLIYRIKKDENFIFPHSYCSNCKHKLFWQDLIPIFNFIILKGKCRYCQKPISWQYPLVELATGILFIIVTHYSLLVTGYFFYSLLVTGYQLLVTCFLIIIFVYDLKHYIIPNQIIYPAIGVAFIYNLIFNYPLFTQYLLVAILVAGFFFLIVFISRGKWLGLGDVKLAFFMGLFLGFPNILVALFFAFLIGAIIGIGLISFTKKTLKSEIPFGPFLVTGTLLALFFGEKLINWYLNFLKY